MNLPAAILVFCASVWIVAVAAWFGLPALYAVASLSIPIEAAR